MIQDCTFGMVNFIRGKVVHTHWNEIHRIGRQPVWMHFDAHPSGTFARRNSNAVLFYLIMVARQPVEIPAFVHIMFVFVILVEQILVFDKGDLDILFGGQPQDDIPASAENGD